jgi:RNA processing factor Prp31
MGKLLNEQVNAMNTSAQQLRAWYLEHFPELKDLLPSDWTTGSSIRAADWANLVLLLGALRWTYG